ncbi:MAG: ATP-binding cassette domain-containing protein [Erysipelotrichaceae bacterium]|nr:ATP-binding cassette domain-containing protein [Erysipelotrichaceae bacterium]
MSVPVIEVKNLKKYFKTSSGMLHAVDDVSFKIEEGKTMGIVGESGCGKSTLGRTIIHLQEPTGGQILYNGQDITRVNKKQLFQLRQVMQIIFQDPYSSLNPRMTVDDTLREPLKLSGKYKGKELDNQVSNLMDMVGIAKRLAMSYPHEMDGGRRQRVGIGRALALGPKFIVCDEPVSALDVSIQAQVLNLLMDLQKEHNMTYMFITHDLSVVKHISDTIGVMYLGQLVETAETDELFKHPLHPYTEALLSAIPSVDIHKKNERIVLKGELTSPINPKPGCRFAPRCSFACEKCEQSQNLSEIGKKHFVACCRIKEIRDL